MNFCPVCGARVALRVPDGDNRPRWCCDHCGSIHYENPRLVVGTLPTWEDKILLCRRAIEPRLGYWTLPAGFMENGETVQDGALRETTEEAGAHVQLCGLHAIYDVPEVHQVHVYFRAALIDPAFAPGIESLEVRLFSEAEVPWDSLAFRTVVMALRAHFADLHNGSQQLHTGIATAGQSHTGD